MVKGALTADDEDHRRTALGAAHRLGILDEEIVLRALADPSVAVRRRAIELAARPTSAGKVSNLGPTVVPAILDLLDDPECAEVAAFALGELLLTEGGVGEKLSTQAGHHDDPLARESAVAALGSLGIGLDAVLNALDDVATVRRRAVIALANFEGPEVEAALTAATDDRDWQVRQAAEDLVAEPEDGGDEPASD